MILLEDLISETINLDKEARSIQISSGDTPVGTNWSQNKLNQFIDKYQIWFANCVAILPDGLLKDKFRYAFESPSSPCIKRFLESPLEKISVRESNSYRGIRFMNMHWKYPYGTYFRKPILSQKQILIEVHAVLRQSPETQTNNEEGNAFIVKQTNIIEEQLFDSRKFHLQVHKHGRSHFIERRYFQAVSECSKAYIRYVAKKSRSNEDGARLMSSVLSPGKSLRLNPQQTETEKNEQLGLMNLSTGLVFAARNPIQHEPELDYPISQEDALDLLSLISFLYRQIDKTHYENAL